jgi:hypothetical protein
MLDDADAAAVRTTIGAGTGTITSVTGTAPISSSGGNTPAISISAATTSDAGSMSADDKAKLDKYPLGTAVGQMQYWNGTAWETVEAGTTGQILSINSSGVPEWKSQLSIITAAAHAPIMDFSKVELKGHFNPNNLASAVYFEYGSSTSYGNATETTVYNPYTGNINITASISSGLIAGNTYHARLVVTTVLGTFYSNDITFNYLFIGCSFRGGYVFTMDSTGQHGKVCSENNLSNSASWNDALTLCGNYEVNNPMYPEFYYNDWYLPAIEELQLMYANNQLRTVASLNDGNYWSRDIHGSDEAFYLNFIDGVDGIDNKSATYIVRAVRDF